MTEYEQQSLTLLAALVGMQIAESGDQMRRAKNLGRIAIEHVAEAIKEESNRKAIERINTNPG